MAAVAADAFFVVNDDEFFIFDFFHRQCPGLTDLYTSFAYDAFFLIEDRTRNNDIADNIIKKCRSKFPDH